MREIITKAYKYSELSDEAKKRARDKYRETNTDNYSLDEMMESLKAVFKAARIKLGDWRIGAYGHSYVRFNMGDAETLTGKRAAAWLENNLFGPLRITRAHFNEHRKDYLKYGDGYRIGQIKSCALTGMCYDEDLFESLRKSVRAGHNLRDAFAELADVVRRLDEAETEGRNEDDAVAESIEANEYEFDEDGDRI